MPRARSTHGMSSPLDGVRGVADGRMPRARLGQARPVPLMVADPTTRVPS